MTNGNDDGAAPTGAAEAGDGSPRSYSVRVEYPVIFYGTAEVEALSPEEAAEKARALDQAGLLLYDQDHETLADDVTIEVYEDEEGLRREPEPLRVEKGRYAAMAEAGPDLLAALKGVIGYARSRAEDLHEAAEESGDPEDFAAWRRADAAVANAERRIERAAAADPEEGSEWNDRLRRGGGGAGPMPGF